MTIFTRLVSYFSLLFTLAVALPAYSQLTNDDPFASGFGEQTTFLDINQAFAFDFQQNKQTLSVTFTIAPDYYLYKKQFKVATKQAELGEPSFPDATLVEDEFYGETEVFFNTVTINYPILSSVKDGVVKLRYQGCAKAGFCYPPTTQVIYLDAVSADTPPQQAVSGQSDNASSQYSLADELASGDNLPLTLLAFIALGIGLAFTPCVFPMYPIISSIVLGQNRNVSTGHALKLSIIYVQGMAITYSLLGLVVASVGVKFQAFLQNPIILGVMIALFITLALSLFGLFEIQLPSRWQEKLNNMSNQQSQGQVVGVFVMGIISGLVASPCTTAPLTGILLFIGQSGDMVLGFASLYALSIGMGIPLIIFAVTGGKLLPKAGNWMTIVKTTFGFFMLAVAVFFVERLVPESVVLLLWSVLGISASVYYLLQNADSRDSIAKFARLALILLGFAASVIVGYSGLLSLKQVQNDNHVTQAHPTFTVVKDLDDLHQKIAAANAQGKSVMVDLYADWCVACKEFEKYTFPDPAVVDALSNTVWMQIDLTDNTPTNIAFQEAFDILGLPTILFFNQQGIEIKKARVTGFMQADAFAKHARLHLSNDPS